MPRVTAVVENGTLRADAPAGLAEGQRVEVVVLDSVPELGPATDEEITAFDKALDEWYEATAELSQEWWDDFDQFLRENRFNIEERFDPLSLGHEHDLGDTPPRSVSEDQGRDGTKSA